VFNWPGMGQATVVAIGRRDYPVVMGVIVIFSITVLLANLVADIAYAAADPRIRLG
jgi:peptide/nickel transport system permease protein